MSNNTQNPAQIKGSFSLPQEQLRLVDGTIVRRCPTVKPLYCSRDGRFFSVSNAILTDCGWILREIKSDFPPSQAYHTAGSRYPKLRSYPPRSCHVIVASTWLEKPCTTTKLEVDHLNGDKFNWSADNLQYVTPEENHRRAKILRALRSRGIDPKTLTREQLLEIFNAQNL